MDKRFIFPEVSSSSILQSDHEIRYRSILYYTYLAILILPLKKNTDSKHSRLSNAIDLLYSNKILMSDFERYAKIAEGTSNRSRRTLLFLREKIS